MPRLDSLRRLGIPIALVPGLRGLPVTGFRQHYFLGHDIVMLVGSSNLTRPMSRLLKAAFDQIAAIILLVSVRAAAVALAMLIRADGGPALFRHRRIGAGGRMFDCIKFRSMVVDAEGMLRRLLAADRKRRPNGPRPRSCATIRGSPASGASCAPPASMNCRSCSTCCAAR